jgi:uroporphyrin-III C-methyltransferase
MKFDYNANVIDFKAGTVIIAGSGPGSEKLITLKVFYALKAADIVIYDALVNPKFIDYCKKNVKRIYAGKTGSKRACSQEQINDWLVKYAKKNKKVLRLKGGDVSFFSRGSQEISFLKKNKIKFKVFTGITSAQAAFKEDNEKKADFKLCLNLITGHRQIKSNTRKINYDYLVNTGGKILVYMGVSQIESIQNSLIKSGMKKNTKILIISNASLENQIIYNTKLKDVINFVKDNEVKPPSIIIIK